MGLLPARMTTTGTMTTGPSVGREGGPLLVV